VRIVVVTGLSGAGKSTALKALEDLDYYCVDNLPTPLLGKFVELVAAQRETFKAALGVDARGGEFLASAGATFAEVRRQGHAVEVLFLDASDDVLVRRFSETRRRHPLSGENVRAGLARERELLKPLRDEADAVVDTGRLNVHQLKGMVQERYGRSPGNLAVTLLSFAFKNGLPPEANVVLDVRFLPNPYFVEALSAGNGLQPAVAEYVLANADAREFLARVQALLDFAMPTYEREGKTYLTIAIGCTGGRHRSVAVAEALARSLSARYNVAVRHRDLEVTA
jgi:UPF0042 nucleotide-binding protein